MVFANKERIKFTIIHDYTEVKGGCSPGEEVSAAVIHVCGQKLWVPWSPTHLVLIDFILQRQHRGQRIPLDAQGIVSKMREDPFVLQHAHNAPCNMRRSARSSRTAVRMQIMRVRRILDELLWSAGIDIKASTILRSINSSTRVVRYFVDAEVEWVHWPADEGEDSGVCIYLS